VLAVTSTDDLHFLSVERMIPVVDALNRRNVGSL
jgi:hypothetical protein